MTPPSRRDRPAAGHPLGCRHGHGGGPERRTAARLRVLSLFAGIGGFDLACQRAGLRVVAQAEVELEERGPRAGRPRRSQPNQQLLARAWPGVPRLGDVRGIDAATIHQLGPIDLVCGGFPCQDLSSAGRRAGLAGPRSSLWWEFVRILGLAAAPWVLVENVPGLLSSNHGRDFGAVLGSLADLGYGYAWPALDAQHFGLAQRRKRVWIVGHLGDGTGPAQVLLEPESSRRDPAPRSAPTQAVAATLGAGPAGGGPRTDPDRMTLLATPAAPGGGVTVAALRGGHHGADDNDTQAGRLLAHTLRADSRHGTHDHNLIDGASGGRDHGAEDGDDVHASRLTAGGVGAGRRAEDDHNLLAGPLGGGNHGRGRRREHDPNLVVARALTAHHAPRNDPTCETLLAHTLPATGANQDGTGRGIPLTPAPAPQAAAASTPPDAHGVYRKATRAHHPGDGETWVAGTLAATLDAAGHAPRTANAVLTPLRASGAYGSNSAGIGRAGDPSLDLDTQGNAGVAGQVGVRRLTPTWCERLQGFPDGWTDGFADSVRYRMLGNAVPVPVAAWILDRITTSARATAHSPTQPAGRPSRRHPAACARHPPPGTPYPPAVHPSQPAPRRTPPRPPPGTPTRRLTSPDPAHPLSR